jgi:hypothetical protein
MVDNLYFLREFASTKIVKSKEQHEKDYKFMGNLIESNFKENEINSIIEMCFLGNSYIYLYYISGIKKFKKKILKYCLRRLIKKPTRIKDTYFRKSLLKTI